MSDLVPEYLTYDYRCTFRGVPGVHHDPDDYPMFWTVKVKGQDWDDEDDGDGKEVTVGEAELYIVPDAGIIDLFLTVGFQQAHGDYLVFDDMPDAID